MCGLISHGDHCCTLEPGGYVAQGREVSGGEDGVRRVAIRSTYHPATPIRNTVSIQCTKSTSKGAEARDGNL